MPDERMPRLGLGTYTDDDREGRREAVRTALDIGYRHVDTAQVYENEEYVGQGLADSEVPREDVFLATKTVHYDVPEPEGEELTQTDVEDAVRGCLDRLGVDYVDLLYVHWPTGIYDPETVLPAYERLHGQGVTRGIGVSNFPPEQMDRAREVLDVPILAHQVECHPLLQQEALRADAREHDHWLVAYSPLGKGAVFDVPEIREIVEKHDASPAQVSLAWLLSKENVAAVPKATGEAHLRDNFAAQDLELDPEDVDRIDDIDREERVIDPDWAPWN
jgi:2,5-diketo-D-gluconate reductase B